MAQEEILKSQSKQLEESYSVPFSEIITPPSIEKQPEVTNPFNIFTGISYIKKINADFNGYMKHKRELTKLITLLKKEDIIYDEIKKIDSETDVLFGQKIKQKLERFENALSTMDAATNVYKKRIEAIEVNVNKKIEAQIYELMFIGILVAIVFFLFFLLKLAVKKYFTDNERYYMANKAINFSNYFLIIVIILFNYIENVSYFVTILGFASAGIAIAMKDWFMSILGWLVIVFGGSIHVGDRIRVDMDGKEFVGDVMDISSLRMTILEDVTLTSIMYNRRAGRIIFIPNNFIFTKMIANYTHSTLKTVWDGINITVTFDSNHKKAMHIAKEITRKYSKGYTDITRKQLNKLRSEYSLKNTNVEPRIFSFIETYGVSIDSWYLTNAYATLTLRSTISVEIVEAFNKEDDITIAFPTQDLYIKREKKTPPFDLGEIA
ncbi:MAG: mechanosensitive ion channel family protein [Sulfurimonas sp.]|nr:mechanosensitive ion channel family protein [Sulfurimonas sp.]